MRVRDFPTFLDFFPTFLEFTDHSSQTVPLVAHETVPLQRSADGVVNPRVDGTIFYKKITIVVFYI